MLDAAGVRRLFACPDYRAAIAGWENWSALVIIIFVTSVPARLLYDPMLNDVYYMLGAGADTRIGLDAFLEGLGWPSPA